MGLLMRIVQIFKGQLNHKRLSLIIPKLNCVIMLLHLKHKSGRDNNIGYITILWCHYALLEAITNRIIQ